jgi:hypothetical protein
MLVYGVANDLVNEYMRMSESTCAEAMHTFCWVVIDVFGKIYLRNFATSDPGLLCITRAAIHYKHMDFGTREGEFT